MQLHKELEKPPHTKGEKIFNIVGYAFYIASILLIIIVWRDLPSEIPAHYDMKGNVDRWGSTFELLILPIVGGLTLLFLQLLENRPDAHNYPSRMNASNKMTFFKNSRKMMNQIKNLCLIIFASITLESIIIAMDWGEGFGSWMLPLLIFAMFYPIVTGLIRQSKIGKE